MKGIRLGSVITLVCILAVHSEIALTQGNSNKEHWENIESRVVYDIISREEVNLTKEERQSLLFGVVSYPVRMDYFPTTDNEENSKESESLTEPSPSRLSHLESVTEGKVRDLDAGLLALALTEDTLEVEHLERIILILGEEGTPQAANSLSTIYRHIEKLAERLTNNRYSTNVPGSKVRKVARKYPLAVDEYSGELTPLVEAQLEAYEPTVSQIELELYQAERVEQLQDALIRAAALHGSIDDLDYLYDLANGDNEFLSRSAHRVINNNASE